jgi:hypothetical protein
MTPVTRGPRKVPEPFDVLTCALQDPATSWSVGTFGALAEFFHEPDQPTDIHATESRLSAATALGRIEIRAHKALRLFPYEGLSSLANAWTQGVLVGLPAADAAMNQRSGLHEIGPPHAGECDGTGNALVFDLGLGVAHLDACICSGDPELVALLRAHAGGRLFDRALPLAQAIRAASPTRIFRSRIATLSVFQAIPAEGDETPLGSHTHLSEKLLSRQQTQAATLPIADGWVPVAAFYPPNPVRDVAGNPRPFDVAAYDSFQGLLEAFASPGIIGIKTRFGAAMQAGSGPEALAAPQTKAERTALRIAIRQFARQFGTSELLSRWQDRFEPAHRNH